MASPGKRKRKKRGTPAVEAPVIVEAAPVVEQPQKRKRRKWFKKESEEK